VLHARRALPTLPRGEGCKPPSQGPYGHISLRAGTSGDVPAPFLFPSTIHAAPPAPEGWGFPPLGDSMSLSAAPSGPACSSRASGWRSRASAGRGFPCCRGLPGVDVPLPFPWRDRRVESLMGRPLPPVPPFANDGGLPRGTGGSAPTFNLSRPARHPLALRPADSLHRRAVHPSRRLRRLRCLHRRSDRFRLERPKLAGRDLHPLERPCLITVHC
jgi:hypothetical protein